MNGINYGMLKLQQLEANPKEKAGEAEKVETVKNGQDADPVIKLMKCFEKGELNFLDFRKQASDYGVVVEPLAAAEFKVNPNNIAVRFKYNEKTYIIQGPRGDYNPNEKSGVSNDKGSSVGVDDIKPVRGETVKGRSINGWGDFLAEIERVKDAIEAIPGDNLSELEEIVNLCEDGLWCCKQAINISGLTQSQLSMVEELDVEFQIERNKSMAEFNTSGLESYEYSDDLYEAYKEAVMGDNTELIESYIDAISSCANVPNGVKVSLADMRKSLISKTAIGENPIIPHQPDWTVDYVDHLSPGNKDKYQMAMNISGDDEIALRRHLLETFKEILTDPCFTDPANAPLRIYLQICCEQLKQFLDKYNRMQASKTVQHEQTAR